MRGDALDVHVYTDCKLRADATTFIVTDAQRVTARFYRHGRPTRDRPLVWEKTWRTSIPHHLG